jgi:hypothetical protein
MLSAGLTLSPTAVLAYCAALAICGVLMLVLGGVGFRQSVGARVLEGLVGAAFLGYAIYLLTLDEGRVAITFWVIIAPILAFSNVARVRERRQVHQDQLAATYAVEAAEGQRRAVGQSPPAV